MTGGPAIRTARDPAAGARREDDHRHGACSSPQAQQCRSGTRGSLSVTAPYLVIQGSLRGRIPASKASLISSWAKDHTSAVKMELVAFGIVGLVWAVVIVGAVRLFRSGRRGLAFAAVVLPGIGLPIALYGLVAPPKPGSSLSGHL